MGARVSCPGVRRVIRRRIQPASPEGLVLGFIDAIVIPFLDQLYAAVGYLGVFFAMVIESTLLPLP